MTHPILIVAHATGFDVFGAPGVELHLVESPPIAGPDAELARDRLLELTLPAPFRDLIAAGEKRSLRLGVDQGEPLDSQNLLTTIGRLPGRCA